MSEKTVSPEQLTTIIIELKETAVRTETKLDRALTNQDDFETRLRTLEKRQWLQMGAASVFGAAVAFVTSGVFPT